ncbi:MAG: hypothetical protein KGD70_12375 [Candidatus Lokiarchaeota archaeon]|jgi:hypothetical protein|nr:hypothetical protein [Candidatus Lokiarchaeota archaeon]
MAQSVKIKQLHQIISALEKFPTRESSKFSLDKLATYLDLSEQEINEILELVFSFQELFSSVLEDYHLFKKWKNNKTYLVLKLKSEVKNHIPNEPKEIEITQEQIRVLNDIVYYFQHVKIGVGFDIKQTKTEFSRKIKNLKRSHPYFFEYRGNGLIYPSKIALEAGKLISFHNKSKKLIKKLEVEDYLIQIV